MYLLPISLLKRVDVHPCIDAVLLATPYCEILTRVCGFKRLEMGFSVIIRITHPLILTDHGVVVEPVI